MMRLSKMRMSVSELSISARCLPVNVSMTTGAAIQIFTVQDRRDVCWIRQLMSTNYTFLPLFQLTDI